MRTTPVLDWSWGQTTPSQSVLSTVGIRKESEKLSHYNHKVSTDNDDKGVARFVKMGFLVYST